jgi:hypothetical protein
MEVREQNQGHEERTQNSVSRNRDLSDSPHDQERLQGDEAILDLPEVKDIPGQEFVQAPPLGMMADTTISSADEEGEGLFDDDTSGDDLFTDNTDLSEEDRESRRTGDKGK